MKKTSYRCRVPGSKSFSPGGTHIGDTLALLEEIQYFDKQIRCYWRVKLDDLVPLTVHEKFASGHASRYLPASSTDFKKVFPLAVQTLDYPCWEGCCISPIMSKILIYLQISQIPQCAINKSNIDSELRKRFFRKFSNFLAPGLQVRKSRISRDMTNFRKIVVILAIFGKSTIFQSPLQSVDEGWHRRHKIFETFNSSIIEPQKMMKKIDHGINLPKNSWGGEKPGDFFPPPRSGIADFKQRESAWEKKTW